MEENKHSTSREVSVDRNDICKEYISLRPSHAKATSLFCSLLHFNGKSYTRHSFQRSSATICVSTSCDNAENRDDTVANPQYEIEQEGSSEVGTKVTVNISNENIPVHVVADNDPKVDATQNNHPALQQAKRKRDGCILINHILTMTVFKSNPTSLPTSVIIAHQNV